ncbi:MAG: monofunctional biosynthetic peptidoglycan transglycosylase [Flavobacteriaceae bacterium]|nr:monofunctional biosynthetic peptidoglycan transglycosylase [Flavobacteriaceae bacterium]
MRYIFKIVFFFLALPWIYAFVLNFIYPPITITQINSLIDGYGLQRDYISGNEIPDNALWAVVSAEDQKFATHNGFDLEGIQKAFEKNKEDEKLRGGSTISQQTAKNIFLWQGRSWLRKGLETYCTFVLETVLSKRRILEIYLNIAEMGRGTFGIEAAGQYYFDKPANELNPSQTAHIIAALPSPKKYNVNPPSAYITRRAKWIQAQVQNLKDVPELRQIIENKP